jgi:hypothetical protein
LTLDCSSRSRVAARIKGRRGHGRSPVRVRSVTRRAIAISRRRRVRRVAVVNIQRRTISIRVAVSIISVIGVPVIAVISVVRVVRVLVLILVLVILILIRVLIIRRGLRFVLVAAFRLLLLLLLLLLVGNAGGAFALFGLRAADVHGDRLPGLDHLARARQLKENSVGGCVGAVARGAHAYVQAGAAQFLFGGLPVLAYDIRHLHLGAAQGKVDSAGHAEEKSQADGDDDSKPAEGRPDAPE